TTASFDVSLSQYVKTNTRSTYQPFTVTAFHSTKNTRLLIRTKVYNSGTHIKIEGAVELRSIAKYKTPLSLYPNTLRHQRTKTVQLSLPNPAVQQLSRSIAQNTSPTKKPRLDKPTTNEKDSSQSVQTNHVERRTD
ncbi:9245_t:CDS:1, partial [Paraglomus brasilianum]